MKDLFKGESVMTDDRLIFEEKAPYLNITVNRPDEGNKFLDGMLVDLADRILSLIHI